MRNRILLLTGILTFCITASPIFSIIYTDWQSRKEKEIYATGELANILANLPAPEGTKLLKQNTGFIQPNYLNDCYGASARLIYGTDRSAKEIHYEYQQLLTEVGWQQSPGYLTSDSFTVYSLEGGLSSSLDIDTTNVENPTSEQFVTVYSVYLSYGSSCRG